MPIPLPNLDDRTYADLASEAQALIPGLCPGWTNHNASDPGIVLVELLAWLTEMTLYQLNEIPPRNIETFLGLLGWTRPEQPAAGNLDTAVRETIRAVRKRYRAVTAEDFELLIREQWPSSPEAKSLGGGARIRRMCCIPQCNLAAAGSAARKTPAPAHVSIVILPDTGDPYGRPSEELLDALDMFFQPRRLLTARHHIVGPSYVPVEVSASLFLRDDAPPETTLTRAIEALYSFFDPLHGGPEKRGWPFGRDVYISEIYTLFDEIDLVEYVEGVNVRVAGDDQRLIKDGETSVGVALAAHELVDIKVTGLTAVDVNGNRYASEHLGVLGRSVLG